MTDDVHPGRSAVRVGFRCDAGVTCGVGHLVRCVALAEELDARGIEVVFLGEVCGSEWARAQLRERGYALVPAPPEPAALAVLAGRLGLGAVVLDSYHLPPETGATLRAAGLTVLAIVDGDPLGQEADLYLDQNLGADQRPFHRSRERLAGARYVLLRDSVRRRGRAPSDEPVPHVLCFFGGTDGAGVAPAWARALRETGRPFRGTVISPVPFEAGDPITVIPPTDRLPELMAGADLVVTAAGSAIWELLYLGVPTALSWVADNQLIGYEELVGRGVAAGLGRAADAAAVGVLARLLADPAAREEQGGRGRGLVDGRGRERVADALLAIV
ncbi:Spore coat polysaccharide biosynthesis protein SpsG, predicted glycosyltransferase [Nonomuraea solani]|uniref:Spore coat polysaccharide biosynthesis protein SpsG, predicted glycosyltransferase n=1 Tax=Nonomuraea solani TaxID=1144553 RepID=A0A1H6EQC3_9ACTN|nr:spore coat protein [Nonomuraea solani]SEG99603.1 Spore coat polysaccharide biosynthesis protein SpsG, predicted glycosyltransferase [Nonomuraea solani]